MSALLELAGVSAYYGVSQALFDLNLTVADGEAVALMGRNGMGKTTSILAATRMLRQTTGTIRFAGRDTTGDKSHMVARAGIGLVPEGRRCFAPLTVHENLVAAARPGEWDLMTVGRLFPRLEERRNQLAGSLSGGEQQMLAIGRALMTNPRLLILDEATEGLAPVVRQEIWAAITKLKGSGLSILVVDKSVHELSDISDRCVILEKGTAVWSGAPAALSDDIKSRYLGV